MPGSVQLCEDSGENFRDKNAAPFPNHPLEPAVTACLTVSPNLPADVDVVACGSTLGNLLRFIRGQDKTSRMPVEKVGNTVLLWTSDLFVNGLETSKGMAEVWQ